MEFYVYVIRSERDGSYYKGSTTDPLLRLLRHNKGETPSTKSKIPWQIVHLEIFFTKTDALIREKKIKKYSHSQLEQLFSSSKNKLQQYLQQR